MTAKTLNFVYEWIGPKGPITNNRVPTIADLSWAEYKTEQPSHAPYDLVQHPHFYSRFEDANIVPACNIKSGEKFLYEINFSNYHYRDWRLLFSINGGPFSNNINSIDVVNEVTNGNGYILVTILFEGWAHDKLFDAMTSFFQGHDVPLNKVVYVTNCYNADKIYKDYCKKKNIQPLINMEYFPTFRYDKTDLEVVVEKYKNMEYTPGPRKKDFLCFQRRWSDHRIAFFLAMHKMGLLDNFYMSMDKVQPESGRSFESNAHYLAQKYPLGFTQDDILKAENVLPLILDTTDFSNYPMESGQFDTEQFYHDSLINIVSETFFFSPEIHITEKTFKPIVFMQPFIMMGATGSLQHVKDMGFKTFSDYWDESYDLIEDDLERLKAIINIVNDISLWSADKKIEFSYNIKDIVEYNSKHFATMSHIELDNFRNKYGN